MAEKPQKIIKCPVCGEKYWSHAMKGHITNMGKAELYRYANVMMNRPENERIMTNMAVLRNSPHYKFRRGHIKSVYKFII